VTLRRYALAIAVLILVTLVARMCATPVVDATPDLSLVDADGWPVGFPKMPAAKVIKFAPQEAWFDMEFSVPGPPSGIIAFYTQQLKAKGWTTEGQLRAADQAVLIRFDIRRPARFITFTMPAQQEEVGHTHVLMTYML
jgi:hypothetical protein